MTPESTDPVALRRELFDLLQEAQGYGFVSDASDRCGSLSELCEYAEDVAYDMQSAANKARGFARRVRRLASEAGE